MIFFYISNEGVSLLENAGHLGLPIPQKVKEVLEHPQNIYTKELLSAAPKLRRSQN